MSTTAQFNRAPSTQKPSPGARRQPSPPGIAAAVLGALFVLFAVLNSQTVTIHLLIASNRMPLIVVIVVCGAVGFVAGRLVSRRRATRDK